MSKNTNKNDALKLENEALKLEINQLNENAEIDKLENNTLKNVIDALKLEIENLKNEINQLNENTVIESMNDMKKQLQDLEENTVPVNVFMSLKNNYKHCYNVSISVNNINDIILEELNAMQNCNFTEDYKTKIIDSTINSLEMVSKIINNHEEWNENECHCYDHDH